MFAPSKTIFMKQSRLLTSFLRIFILLLPTLIYFETFGQNATLSSGLTTNVPSGSTQSYYIKQPVCDGTGNWYSGYSNVNVVTNSDNFCQATFTNTTSSTATVYLTFSGTSAPTDDDCDSLDLIYSITGSFAITIAPCYAGITPVGSATNCSGQHVVLNANSGKGFTYQWSNNGTAISGATSASYTATASGAYTVKEIISPTCTTSSAISNVSIGYTPSATISPSGSVTACGSQVLNANIGSGYNYQWYNNGTAISGANNASYTTTASGAYTVKVTNGACSATSTATNVTIKAAPIATIDDLTTPYTDYVCVGNLTALEASIGQNSGLSVTYQWNNSTGPISGATNWVYDIGIAETYTVTVSGNGCSATSAPFTIINNPAPPAVSFTQTNEGCEAILSLNPTPGFSYEWYNNGVAANGPWVNVDGTPINTNSIDPIPRGGSFGYTIITPNGTPYITIYNNPSSDNAGYISVANYNGTSWVDTTILPNSAAPNGISACYAPLALNPITNLPYLAYISGNNELVVMSFNGTNWVNFGSSISATYSPISLALDANGIPYVSNGLNIWKYSNGSWLNISPPGTSFICSINNNYAALAINPSNNFPCLAYSDYYNSGNASVITYNGTSWGYAGNAGFSLGYITSPSLAFNASGTPYLAYVDHVKDGISAMYLMGLTWVSVGEPGFMSFVATPLLTFSPSGTPYIACANNDQSPLYGGNLLGIMAYNGTGWVYAGDFSSTNPLDYFGYVGFDANGYMYTTASNGNVAKYKISNMFNGGSSYSASSAGNYSVFVLNNSTGCYNYSTYTNTTPVTTSSVVISTSLASSYQAGQAVSIPYTACSACSTGNVFTAQLSDASGSFASPVAIGTLSSTSSGTINAVIPANTMPGTNYQIRIISSTPAATGPSNGTNISITNSSGTLRFNGILGGERVIIPNSNTYNISGNFTIEAWVNLSPTQPYGYTAVASNRTTAGTDGFMLTTTNGTQLWLQIAGINYSSNTLVNNSGIAINIHDNNCHHVAVSRLSGVLSFYVDGVPQGTTNTTGAINSTGYLYIGYDVYDNYSTNGSIDDVRIWNIGESQGTINTNKSLIVPGNSTGLVGYWDFNEAAGIQAVYDQSTTANNGSLGTNPTAVDAQDPARVEGAKCFTPILESGLVFNVSAASRATIPNNPAYNFGTGTFTIEAWVNLSSQTGTAPGIASTRTSLNGFLFSTLSGNDLLLEMGGTNYYSHGFANIEGTGCHHIAVASTGAGALQFYLDGIALGGTIPCSTSVSSAGPLYIGYDIVNGNTLNGNINEVRIWNVTRTAAQISGNLTTVFPVGTSNLVGYWKLNESGDEIIYDQSLTANNGYLGTNQYDFDAQNPIRTTNACYSGDRLSDINPIGYKIDSSAYTNNSINDFVKIYPNPFNTTTNIIVSGNSTEQTAIRIFDLKGVTLYTGHISFNTEYSIGQQLSSGMYFVEVTGQDNQPHVYKIIKAE